MQITNSYGDPDIVPPQVRKKYVWLETGNAAAILRATSPAEYGELIAVLDDFTLRSDIWLVAGGNKGDIADMLDQKFRQLGWKETRIDTEVRGVFVTDFVKNDISSQETAVSSVYSEGYRVDNHKGRMIVDIEWNAKDGNLDRDLAAYRSWHEYGLINGAVIITKDRLALLKLARTIWDEYGRSLPGGRAGRLPVDLQSSTTTSFDKAELRVKRQGAGTCPVLVVGVTAATWDGSPFTGSTGEVQSPTPSLGFDELER